MYDARVNVPPAFVEHPAVGNVVSERMLEAVLQVRKDLRRVEKLSSLQIVEHTAKPGVWQRTNGLQQREWEIVPNHCRLFQQALFGSGQRINTRGEHCPHGGRD